MNHRLLNSAFVDGLESDIELLEQMNELLEISSEEILNNEGRPLRPIDIEVISPSEDIDAIAEEHAAGLPTSVRTFLRVSGGSNSDGGVNIASYLLFTQEFCQRLIDLGYKDGLEQEKSILELLAS